MSTFNIRTLCNTVLRNFLINILSEIVTFVFKCKKKTSSGHLEELIHYILHSKVWNMLLAFNKKFVFHNW